MKKMMLTIVAMVVAIAASAQNSAIYKIEHFVEKGQYDEALPLIEAALANPKTTKFAGFYYNKAEINRKKFEEILNMNLKNFSFVIL